MVTHGRYEVLHKSLWAADYQGVAGSRLSILERGQLPSRELATHKSNHGS